jgi:hypothetical protein
MTAVLQILNSFFQEKKYMIFKMKAVILSMIMAIFLISSVEAKAPKKDCNTLSEADCSKRTDCSYVKAHFRKNGKAVKAHCKSNAKKGKKGTKAGK